MVYGACAGVVLLFVAMLGACALGESSPPQNVLKAPFSLTADYTDGTLTGALHLERTDAQNFTLTFTSPESIAGFTVAVSGGQAVMTFGDIRSERALESLPERNPARALSALFSQADTDKASIQAQKSGDTVYEFPDGATMTVYAGSVKAIELPAADLLLKITGFDAGE